MLRTMSGFCLVMYSRTYISSGASVSGWTASTLAVWGSAASGFSSPLFSALSERTAELEKKTAEAASDNEKLMALNRASLEMLKEVFTAARLPVTSKEELSAIYRRALDAVADEGEAPS